MRRETPARTPNAPSSAVRWRRDEAGAVVLALYVQPGAKRTEIAGVRVEEKEVRLKVRLAAPPVEGKANAALRQFLAEAFGVSLAAVTLTRGEASRAKIVRIERPARRPDHAWEGAFGR